MSEQRERIVIDLDPGKMSDGWWFPESIEIRRDGEPFLLIAVMVMQGDKHVIIYDDPEQNPVLTFQIRQP